MDLGLSGKTALVTGGSRGIGRSCALALAREGCNIAITARGAQDLQHTVEEITATGVQAIGIALDMAHQESAESAVSQTIRATRQLDILVNNVGGALGARTFADAEDDDWHATLNVNLWPAIRASRAVLPHMRTQGSEIGRAHV